MNTPKHKLGKAMQHMVEQGKRPCFRLGGIRITRASNDSHNPGYLYIKNDSWDYIGKINPEGLLQIQYRDRITSAQKKLVLEAIIEPELTAMSSGKVTGTCCCCGRTLTNKLSIELGIGPICRELWFPEPVDTTSVDTVAMLETLDTLERTKSKEPVMELFNNYLALNSTQQAILANMIKTDYWSKNSNASN